MYFDRKNFGLIHANQSSKVLGAVILALPEVF